MKYLIISLIFIALAIWSPVMADKDEHGHDHGDHKEDESAKHDHDEAKGHDEKTEHHDGEEDKEHKHDEHKADEKHGDHKEDEKHGDHNEGEKHEDHKEGEKEHADHEEGGHDEHGENSQVGPGKGIQAASEEEGIRLSAEAEKNFEILLEKVRPDGSALIPKIAVVTAVAEVNLYRFRAGFYKRIDFEQVGTQNGDLIVRSKDLGPEDSIVVKGQGFLRIAEIAAFGGAPEGHSH